MERQSNTSTQNVNQSPITITNINNNNAKNSDFATPTRFSTTTSTTSTTLGNNAGTPRVFTARSDALITSNTERKEDSLDDIDPSHFDDYGIDTTDWNDPDIDDFLQHGSFDGMEAESYNNVTTSTSPFRYLVELQDLLHSDSGDKQSNNKAYDPLAEIQTVRIKAAVTNTIPPFIFTNRFSLKVKIDDATATTIALLSDHVISQLLGLSYNAFRANLQSPHGKEDNMARLKRMEVQLAGLEGVMTLEFSTGNASGLPVIVDIAPPTQEELLQWLQHLEHK